MRGLLDTSVIVGLAAERVVGVLPEEAAISVITLEELSLGVQMAQHRGDDARARSRQATLDAVGSEFEALPVTRSVAFACAGLRAEGRRIGVRYGPSDALIAGTALVHGLSLYTHDVQLGRLRTLDVRVV